MTRFDEEKGWGETRTEACKEECLEGTSARTRPFCYDAIMLARKTKGSKTTKVDRNSGVGVINAPLDGEMVSHSRERRSTPGNVSSQADNLKHITQDTGDGISWRNVDPSTHRKNEESVGDKHVGSQGSEFKLKSVVERNFRSNTEHDMKVGRFRNSITEKGVLLNDDHVRESHKKNYSFAMRKVRASERSEEKYKVDSREHHNGDKKLPRKRKIVEHRSFYPENEYRNRSTRDVIDADKLADQVRDITVQERRHKHHNEVGSIRGRISGKKHDSEKKQANILPGHGKESRSSRRRSLSREHVDDRNRNSDLHSENIPQQTIVDNGEHRDLSLSSKEKLRREHSSTKKKRLTSTESGSQHGHNFGSSSGIGGYSPRKRKTDAGGKTPPPVHHSPKKRTARWDLEKAESQGNSNDATLSNMEKVTQSSSLNNIELPGGTPITSAPLKPIQHAFTLHMQAVESVQLTEATRPMRRLYVDNLPASASEKDLIACVNQFLLSSGVDHVQGTQPCISCIIHKDKGQALLEFLTPEYASAALTLKTPSFLGSNIILRRPKDYAAITAAFPEKSMSTVDSISDIVEDSPHKIFMGGISSRISSKMLLDVATAFGTVKAFHFQVNDEINEPCAFLEYADHSVTSKACAGLSGLRLGGKVVTAVIATPDVSNHNTASSLQANFGKTPFYGIPEHAKPLLEKPTPVLKLKNVLDPEHLSSMTESELEGVLTDIKLECSRFGVVKSINIVKPMHTSGTTERSDAKNDNASTNGCSIEYDTASRTQQVTASVSKSGEPTRSESQEALVESENTDEQLQGNCSDLCGSISDLDKSELIDINRQLEPCLKNGTSPALDFFYQENSGYLSAEPETSTNPDVLSEIRMEIEHLPDEEMHSDNMKIAASAAADEAKELDASSKCTRDADDDDETDLSSVFEAGSVFIEYRRSEAACLAAHSLHGRTFDGRFISAGYVDEALYRKRFGR